MRLMTARALRQPKHPRSGIARLALRESAVPTSTKPNPSAPMASTQVAFLSKPGRQADAVGEDQPHQFHRLGGLRGGQQPQQTQAMRRHAGRPASADAPASASSANSSARARAYI